MASSLSSTITISGASEAQSKMLADIEQKFSVSDEHLQEIAEEVYRYLGNGLESDTAAHALPCRVSHIAADITDDIREAKKEDRSALGLTINTTAQRMKIASVKFAVAAPDIINKQVFGMRVSASATTLFNDAAMHIAQFINTHALEGSSSAPLPLGVTVDLPLDEPSGRVESFSGSILDGVDIAQSLGAALLRQHLPVRVVAASNCVISTMVAAQHKFQSTCAALILNHGINAAYYERASSIPKVKDVDGSARLAINTELARFGEDSDVLAPTMWDHCVDRESSNTGRHSFEKLVADRYLGEIVRNLVTDFMDAQLIFPKDADASTFSEPYSFFTSYMTIMDDASEDLREVGDLLCAGFNISASHVDRQIVRALCCIVAMRAAKLVGAATAAIIRKATDAMDTPAPAVISISGQLSDMNQPYVQCTSATARKLAAKLSLPEPVFNVLGEDGYTVGAALSSFSGR